MQDYRPPFHQPADREPVGWARFTVTPTRGFPRRIDLLGVGIGVPTRRRNQERSPLGAATWRPVNDFLGKLNKVWYT